MRKSCGLVTNVVGMAVEKAATYTQAGGLGADWAVGERPTYTASCAQIVHDLSLPFRLFFNLLTFGCTQFPQDLLVTTTK
jgi:hypothetical protein